MRSKLNVICEDEFWNSNLSWYTNEPKLTRCLSQIGFNFIFNLVFLLIIAIEFANLPKLSNKRISINKYNVTRFLICLFSIILNLILLMQYAYPILFVEDNPHTMGDFLASLSKLLVAVCLIVIFHYHRMNGIITSANLFIVTFLISVTSGILLLDSIFNAEMYHEFERQNAERIFLCMIGLFVLNCFADDPANVNLKEAESNENLIENIDQEHKEENIPPSPKEYSSFLSKITFYWFTKFVTLAAKKQIELNDIWELEDQLKVKNCLKKFEYQYFKELQKIENPNNANDSKIKFNAWHCLKVMWRVYNYEFLVLSFIKLMFDILNFMSPLLLSALIKYIEDPEAANWHGWLIVIGFLNSTVLKNILLNNYFERGVGLGMKLNSSLMSLIFSKALRLGPESKKSRTTGEIVNLISIDCGRFSDLAPFIAFFWSAPLQLVIGLYLVYKQLSSAVFIGISIIIIILGINSVLIHFQKKFYLSEMKTKDKRIKLINEVLSGIRIIKFYGWESPFEIKISNERVKEVRDNKFILFFESVNFVLYSMSPTLVLASTISFYLFIDGGTFTAENIFVSITLFNILWFPLEIIPVLFAYYSMCKVGLSRISSFLSENELDSYVEREFDEKMALRIKNKARFVWENLKKSNCNDKLGKDGKKVKNFVVKYNGNENVHNLTSDEEKSQDQQANEFKNFELKDIEMEVEKGSMVAIIGSVGSGKSSLISAILGEMYLIENEAGVKGKVNISEDQSICYVAQQAWIQNAKLKDNILFGKAFNEAIYKDVIYSCALKADLMQLEGGDETEIGEKGINLSGGQKQRVSLARACYSSMCIGDGKQIILLDDPLSAVDAHVSRHLCENVLNSETGILKNTTRILVTNQLNQLSDLGVDQIILLKDGKIGLKCSYEELMTMEKNGLLDEFDLRLQQSENESKESDDDDKKSEESKNMAEEDEEFIKKESKKDVNKSKLIESEKIEKGRVSLTNYTIYLKYFGYTCAILTTVFFIAETAFGVWNKNFLATWTNTTFETDDIEIIKKFNKENLIIYICVSSFQCGFNFLGNILVVFGIIRTVKLFHKNLLHKILRSPMKFFDTTPTGRIVNRFSKDIDAIDKTLPRAIREFLLAFLNLSASITIILIKQPSSFIFYFLIFVIFYFIMDLYINSSRQLKRFDSTTRSPIYSHFSETIVGTSTIRAFDKVNDFENESRFKIQTNNRASWYNFQGNRWLGFYLELLSSVILFTVSIQLIFKKHETSSGEVGLLISSILNLNESLIHVVRFYSMFEANIVSVERINEYCNNEEEDDWEKTERPDENWPKQGEIEFKNYSTRYRENTSLVLKNLNFKVNGSEKVGIVGRTGAGKSSITLALFRIIEPVEGQIIIDNVDIGRIGLHDLRSKLSIIPQDPVLFTGSIRFNLDPFDKHSDDEIYQSLEHAHLRNYVNSLENGIYYTISEGGENLSVGQRQLICLARALLRKSKILVLDEATASVDFSTDELVQNTIRTEFANCTTITIAHRLKTVVDSSKILVLDKGELHEYDSPNVLLKNPNSLFYFLAQKANLI